MTVYKICFVVVLFVCLITNVKTENDTLLVHFKNSNVLRPSCSIMQNYILCAGLWPCHSSGEICYHCGRAECFCCSEDRTDPAKWPVCHLHSAPQLRRLPYGKTIVYYTLVLTLVSNSKYHHDMGLEGIEMLTIKLLSKSFMRLFKDMNGNKLLGLIFAL
jgi:hypothetical protein